MGDLLSEDGAPIPPAIPRVRQRLGSAHVQRERRRRVITWSLSAALAVLLVNAVVGENGYLAARRAREEQAELQTAVAKLRVENQELLQESRRLQSDPAAVEEAARRELGFVRPGETLIVLRDVKTAARPGGR
jgi:cell division protein FtsB